MSISGNFPSQPPTLLLDFANSSKLDPRITFTRASTATYYDGQTSVMAEQNLFTQSNFQSGWLTTNGATYSNSSNIAAPDGSNTAAIITLTNATNSTVYQQYVTTLPGTYTMSVYVSVPSGNATFHMYYYNPTDGNGYTTQLTANTTWQRFTFTATVTTTTSWYPMFTLSDSGGTFYCWGAQLEQRANATAYIATTTTAITNYIPQLMTAANNVPRFDCNPVTRESLGLLIEESRTNLITNSNAIGLTGWTLNGVTISANTIAPDGSNTAQKITEGTTSGTLTALKIFGTASSNTTYTQSVYLKDAGSRYVIVQCYEGGTLGNIWGAQFDLVNGVTAFTCYSGGVQPTSSIVSVGNGWYRCIFTFTTDSGAGAPAQFQILPNRLGTFTTNPYSYTGYTGNGYSGIYAWGAQLEVGAFVTSYIPTTSSIVTRNADNASMTGTNFSSWYNQYQGTLYGEADYFLYNGLFSGGYSIVQLDDSTNNNQFGIRYSHGGQYIDNFITINGTYPSQPTIYTSNSGFNKIVANYSLANTAFTFGGVGITSTPGTYTVPLFNRLVIGTNYSGYIRKIAYWPQALTNTQLQALTKS